MLIFFIAALLIMLPVMYAWRSLRAYRSNEGYRARLLENACENVMQAFDFNHRKNTAR